MNFKVVDITMNSRWVTFILENDNHKLQVKTKNGDMFEANKIYHIKIVNNIQLEYSTYYVGVVTRNNRKTTLISSGSTVLIIPVELTYVDKEIK